MSLSNDLYFDAVRAALYEEKGGTFLTTEMNLDKGPILMRRVGQYLNRKGYSPDEIRHMRSTVVTLYDFAITSQDNKWAKW